MHLWAVYYHSIIIMGAAVPCEPGGMLSFGSPEESFLKMCWDGKKKCECIEKDLGGAGCISHPDSFIFACVNNKCSGVQSKTVRHRGILEALSEDEM